MSKRPIRLGEMLVQMGRVTADEVERALAHQHAHGGYMGDALVALGILTREELGWGLANQHDIPFVAPAAGEHRPRARRARARRVGQRAPACSPCCGSRAA